MENLTTIQITQETRQKIFALGKKGESYDDIINRVMFPKEKKKEVTA